MPLQGPFQPVTRVLPSDAQSLAQVHLQLPPVLRQRVFYFDYGFGPRATQQEVYEELAAPVVRRVLEGYNGTVFAYGQTGTGKTHTMGILDAVTDATAGIVPRAVQDVFKAVTPGLQVRMSFLQIYRETIQDLLVIEAPPAGSTPGNLCIRESRDKGFYVEGLSEFLVSSYAEAEAIVNLGLQHRAMAPTLLNTTSSRSHTVLTVSLTQPPGPDADAQRRGTLRSKLLLVDLAGSERVRRGRSATPNSGAVNKQRLHETKSINSSLSALGNVIATLAAGTGGHVPYRNSKLTRLLQDSLGGTASTALVACIAPSPTTQQETLSTLLFASRCMHVTSDPVRHEHVNYAELCATLQARLATLQQDHRKQLETQRHHQETVVARLEAQLRNRSASTSNSASEGDALAGAATSMLFTPERWEAPFRAALEAAGGGNTRSLLEWPTEHLGRLTQFLLEALSAMAHQLHRSFAQGLDEAHLFRTELEEALARAEAHDARRRTECQAMARWDPAESLLDDGEDSTSGGGCRSHHAAWRRVERRHPAPNPTAPSLDALLQSLLGRAGSAGEGPPVHPQIHDFRDPNELASYVTQLVGASAKWHVEIKRQRTQSREAFGAVKEELARETLDGQRREEEAMNASAVLKHLLATNSQLRQRACAPCQPESRRDVPEAPGPESSSGSPSGPKDPGRGNAETFPRAASGDARDGARRLSKGGRRRSKGGRVQEEPGRPPRDGRREAEAAPASLLDAVVQRTHEDARRPPEMRPGTGKLALRKDPAAKVLAHNSAVTRELETAVADDASLSPRLRAESMFHQWRVRRSSQNNISPVSPIHTGASRGTDAAAMGLGSLEGFREAGGGMSPAGEGDSALAIMSKVKRLTEAEVDALPPSTRQAVLLLRRELGLSLADSQQRPSDA